MLFVWVQGRVTLGQFVTPLHPTIYESLKCEVEIVQHLVKCGSHLSQGPLSTGRVSSTELQGLGISYETCRWIWK